MKTRARDLSFIVEGRCLPVPSDADCVPFRQVARFSSEEFARLFLDGMGQYNAESAQVDKYDLRLKVGNKILPRYRQNA